MVRNICKTCHYWGRYRESTCDIIGLNTVLPEPTGADIFVKVLDDSGLEADLVTGPNFGCTLWKEKRND